MVCWKLYKEYLDPDLVFLGHTDPDPNPNFQNRIRSSGSGFGKNWTGLATLRIGTSIYIYISEYRVDQILQNLIYICMYINMYKGYL